MLESPKGLAMMITPNVFPEGVSPGQAKDMLAAQMREFIREHSVYRYVQGAEAWTVREIGDHRGSLADHPERREAIVILGDDGREQMAGKREIMRPGWRPPYLGPVEIERLDGMSEGRFHEPAAGHAALSNTPGREREYRSAPSRAGGAGTFNRKD
jgi:hypothetical protein